MTGSWPTLDDATDVLLPAVIFGLGLWVLVWLLILGGAAVIEGMMS